MSVQGKVRKLAPHIDMPAKGITIQDAALTAP